MAGSSSATPVDLSMRTNSECAFGARWASSRRLNPLLPKRNRGRNLDGHPNSGLTSLAESDCLTSPTAVFARVRSILYR